MLKLSTIRKFPLLDGFLPKVKSFSITNKVLENGVLSTYDETGRHVLDEDIEGNRTIYEEDGSYKKYNKDGVLIKELSPDGTITEWDLENETKTTTLPDGSSKTYDKTGKIIRETDANGITRVYYEDGSYAVYDHDRLVREVDKYGNITTYDVDGCWLKTDPNGEVLAKRDVNGNVQVYDYDNKTITNYNEKTPDIKTVTDFDGRVIYKIDENGNKTTYNADGSYVVTNKDGRVIAELKPNGDYYAYDADGSYRVYDKYGNITTYDANGNKISYFDKAQNSTTTYNPNNGNKIKTEYHESGVLIEYDENGFIHKRINGDEITEYNVDENGRVTGYTQSYTSNDEYYKYAVDPKSGAAVLVEHGDSEGNVTKYELDGSYTVYDKDGKKTKYVDAAGNTTEYTETGYTTTNPDGYTIVVHDYETGRHKEIDPLHDTYVITVGDEIVEMKTADGTICVYNPDGSRDYTYADGSTTHVNADGSRINISADGTIEYYDTADYMYKRVTAEGDITEYDKVNNTVTVNEKKSELIVVYKRDENGDLKAIKETNKTTGVITIYDPYKGADPVITTITNPDGTYVKTKTSTEEHLDNAIIEKADEDKVITNYLYDKDGVMYEYIVTTADGVVTRYDANGNIIEDDITTTPILKVNSKYKLVDMYEDDNAKTHILFTDNKEFAEFIGLDFSVETDKSPLKKWTPKFYEGNIPGVSTLDNYLTNYKHEVANNSKDFVVPTTGRGRIIIYDSKMYWSRNTLEAYHLLMKDVSDYATFAVNPRSNASPLAVLNEGNFTYFSEKFLNKSGANYSKKYMDIGGAFSSNSVILGIYAGDVDDMDRILTEQDPATINTITDIDTSVIVHGTRDGKTGFFKVYIYEADDHLEYKITFIKATAGKNPTFNYSKIRNAYKTFDDILDYDADGMPRDPLITFDNSSKRILEEAVVSSDTKSSIQKIFKTENWMIDKFPTKISTSSSNINLVCIKNSESTGVIMLEGDTNGETTPEKLSTWVELKAVLNITGNISDYIEYKDSCYVINDGYLKVIKSVHNNIVTDALGNTYILDNGNVTSIKTLEGKVYNAVTSPTKGWVHGHATIDGGYLTEKYNVEFMLLERAVTDEDGKTVTTTYDVETGLPSTIVDAEGNKTVYDKGTTDSYYVYNVDGTKIYHYADDSYDAWDENGVKTHHNLDGSIDRDRTGEIGNVWNRTYTDGTIEYYEHTKDGDILVKRILPDGTEYEYMSDGTVKTIYPDGRIYIDNESKGTYDHTEFDGSRETLDEDGTHTKYNVDGSKDVELADGDKYHVYPDGSVERTKPDGTTVVTQTNGTTTTTHPDGTKDIEYPDGNKQHVDTNGTVTTTYTNGNVFVDNPDGSYEHSFTDGRTEYGYTDGSKRINYPDGSYTTVDPSGKETHYPNTSGAYTVTHPDGSVEVHDNKGNWTITRPDGSKDVYNNDTSYAKYDSKGKVTETRSSDGSLRKFDSNGMMTYLKRPWEDDTHTWLYETVNYTSPIHSGSQFWATLSNSNYSNFFYIFKIYCTYTKVTYKFGSTTKVFTIVECKRTYSNTWRADVNVATTIQGRSYDNKNYIQTFDYDLVEYKGPTNPNVQQELNVYCTWNYAGGNTTRLKNTLNSLGMYQTEK